MCSVGEDRRTPLADDPSFLASLSDLDRGLTNEPETPQSSAPTASPSSPPAGETTQHRPNRPPLRLRTQAQRRVVLPPSITAPFEALTIPEPAPAKEPHAAAPAPAPTQEQGSEGRRPLLELFPQPVEKQRPPIAPAPRTPIVTPSAPAQTPSSPSLDETAIGLAAARPSPSETFYGLSEKPFALSTDPRFFYH